ncbi:MAG: serine/threonine protein kinase [Comamonadaceae bacterium]|nr:MAG: serine/threonine protein kinase [Comamonadaceae bacterium]
MSLKKLGRYDLLRVLGKGAMGIVYEGRDPNLDRRVAIKTVKVENMSEEAAAEYEARFRTEARSAARLQHPNIVSVYDSDRDGDIAFLVMEFIQGDDLKHHIDKGARYTLDQSLKMIRDLLAALDYAHKQGIVHRDIKPANLLIEPGGRIKLTDFGVARIQDSGEATRTQGAMVGTLKYMSPEQVQGQPVDSRSDLFAVGIVLYQLLTDKRPFDGENDFSIIHQIIGHVPAPPSSINPQLPVELDAVVARALAKKRDERFATARDFAVALQAAIRRATDQTIVPPVNPGNHSSSADTRGSGVTMGSATSATTAGSTSTNTSTVTQELELVYWKDIKDSVEPEEIEGFLVKFPTGIYADLARRRLKKLASGTGDTTLGNFGNAAAASAQDTDATRMRDFTRPLAADSATSPGSSTGSGTGPGSGDYTRTLIQPRGDGTQAPEPVQAVAAAVMAAAVPSPSAAVDPRDAPTIPPLASVVKAGSSTSAEGSPVASRPKPATVKFALAGVAALVLVGVIFKLATGSGVAPATESAASAAASPAIAAVSAAASQPAAAPVSAAAASSASAAASSAAVALAAASKPAVPAINTASAPRLTASQLAARSKPKASAPMAGSIVATPSAAQEHTSPPKAEARAAPVPAPAPVVAGSPKDACEGRMLIGYQICMGEQCARPVFQNHPICVERRDMERRRREAQQQQN